MITEGLQNLHTHSVYDDGKDGLEQIVQQAIKKGFSSIGFSGHSYMPFAKQFSMSLNGTEEYKKEIALLKDKYSGQIDIFCGLEFEMFSEVDLSGYDYIIGSSHYFKINGEHVGFDRSADAVKEVIDNYFEGSGINYAREYYRQLATLPSLGKFDIIGHFDLIAKHSETHSFFEENAEYLSYAYDAVDALAGEIPFFEINTGAMARGYRTTPYPSVPILKRLLEKKFLPIITSDCHDMYKLDYGFERCENLLKSVGAKEKYVLTKNGFKGIKL